MSMIDPLEAMVKWLERDLTCVNGRVAGKHRYGIPANKTLVSAWQPDQVCVVVRLDDGSPELYGPIGIHRFEVRILNETRSPIFDTWRELITLSRASKRFEVVTSLGNVLMYYVAQSSGFSVIRDADLKLEVGLVFFNALIAEEVIV